MKYILTATFETDEKFSLGDKNFIEDTVTDMLLNFRCAKQKGIDVRIDTWEELQDRMMGKFKKDKS